MIKINTELHTYSLLQYALSWTSIVYANHESISLFILTGHAVDLHFAHCFRTLLLNVYNSSL